MIITVTFNPSLDRQQGVAAWTAAAMCEAVGVGTAQEMSAVHEQVQTKAVE